MSNMRIHTDTLTSADIYDAARTARVSLDRFEHKGSRSHDHAFDITLTGESRRRPNNGTSRQTKDPDAYAATWDQWGVFLAVLFEKDQGETFEPSAPMTTPYYKDAEEFATRTGDRFGAPEDEMTDRGYVRRFVSYGWPEDAHGDHTFRFSGRPGQQNCTKCSAIQRWL